MLKIIRVVIAVVSVDMVNVDLTHMFCDKATLVTRLRLTGTIYLFTTIFTGVFSPVAKTIAFVAFCTEGVGRLVPLRLGPASYADATYFSRFWLSN
jgi:hypothetical protein